MANEKRLIDADALENGIAVYVTTNAYLDDTALDALKKVVAWIDESPSVDAVEVVHGRWEETTEADDEFGEMDFYKCSVCGQLRWFKTNYCPNCGAKMDGDWNGT